MLRISNNWARLGRHIMPVEFHGSRERDVGEAEVFIGVNSARVSEELIHTNFLFRLPLKSHFLSRSNLN